MVEQRRNFDRPRNFSVVIPLIDLNIYKRAGDSKDQIINVLNAITWDLIDIPISSPRSFITGDNSSTGNMTIGYISDFNRESEEFIMIIFGRYKELFDQFKGESNTWEELVVFPKTSRINENVKIINLSVALPSFFEYITRLEETKPRREINNRRR